MYLPNKGYSLMWIKIAYIRMLKVGYSTSVKSTRFRRDKFLEMADGVIKKYREGV